VVIERIAQGEVVPTDASLVRRAIATSGDHQLSIWDALVLEAASESGCQELWTEDLTTGATLRGVRIVNPLAQA
jgi:predicted nucleic acid-binding protein